MEVEVFTKKEQLFLLYSLRLNYLRNDIRDDIQKFLDKMMKNKDMFLETYIKLIQNSNENVFLDDNREESEAKNIYKNDKELRVCYRKVL